MAQKPVVIDIYHRTACNAESFRKAKAAGLWGVIHKASQGVRPDPKYAQRRQWALDAGLLWGGYHFNDGDDFKAQADSFVRSLNADGETLAVLDYEVYKRNMDIESCVAFMKIVEDRLGKSCAIYSGDALKSNIHKLNDADVEYITGKRLWLAQYGPRAVLPKGFDRYFLWQYTGDGVGQGPHTIAGFGDGQDMNAYDGTFEDLRTEWCD